MPDVQLTFVFIDLVGFTALTEVHGDHDAADIVDRFVALVRRSLGDGDRLVKTIGDAVMLVTPDPESGVALTDRIVDITHREGHFPQTRAGLHHGGAVERAGDYVGASVNLAARVADQAGPDQTLATAGVAAAARTLEVDVVDRGRFELRNVAEPVDLFELLLCPGIQGTVIDPVCQARIDRERAEGHVRYEAVDYWFCALDCVARFSSHPERYVRAG